MKSLPANPHSLGVAVASAKLVKARVGCAVFASSRDAHVRSVMGLECCDFTAERPNDCDICGQAEPGEHIWVKMAGAYEGATVEAEYYACSDCVAGKHAKEWSAENDSAHTQKGRERGPDNTQD